MFVQLIFMSFNVWLDLKHSMFMNLLTDQNKKVSMFMKNVMKSGNAL
jgi:hypothetical protein